MQPVHTFGAWLRLRRRSLGLTQAQLGEQIGYAGSTLRKVEADELRPSRQLAEKLAEALDITAEERERFVRFARDETANQKLVLTAPVPIVWPLPSAERTHPLFLPRDPLIGREIEVAMVQSLLSKPSVDLVTLTGPGGIGKTRLASQVASELRAQFRDGVFLVLLASLDDPALVLSAIAQVLGVRETEGSPLIESLQVYLRDKQLLLILDNFEQVITAAPLLSELLEHAPSLKLLVTSRISLCWSMPRYRASRGAAFLPA